MLKSVIAYVNSVVGTPWVEGETDCYWLIEDSYRELQGLTLPTPPWRTVDKVAESGREMLKSGQWRPAPEQEGAVFAIYDKQGCMCHVGRILAGLAVHSDGERIKGGQCKAEKIERLKERYKRLGYGIKFYIYEG